MDNLVFSNHDLLDQFTLTQDFVLSLWVIESTQNLGSGGSSESLDAIEVSVLDDHDALVRHELLGVVVDELSVDEDSWLVCQDFLDLVGHFFLFSGFELSHGVDGVDLSFDGVNFDFIIVHWGVGDHDFAVLHSSGAAHRDLFLENETLSKERVTELTSCLFDNLDELQVSTVSDLQCSLHTKFSKIFFFLDEKFRR